MGAEAMRLVSLPMIFAICVAVSGCQNVGSDPSGVWLTATSVPSALNICADYGSRRTCTGEKYYLVDAGTVVRRHEGIDFRAPAGTPVIASAGGSVFWTGVAKCGGGEVITRMGATVPDPVTGKKDRLYVTYHHIIPKVWNHKKIEAGEVIGEIAPVGKYGGRCSTFPHVHLSTRLGGRHPSDHISPHHLWVNGPGIVTCWKEGTEVPADRLVAPLPCS